MFIGIIIVNYKIAPLTIQCLRSLVDERGVLDLQVIVVDNDSQDGSVEMLSAAVESEGWSDWVSIIASNYNGGFSYGNNIAIRQFMKQEVVPKFICLLNPDTFIRMKAITSLVSFMKNNPTVGIAGSRIEGLNGGVQCSSFKFHSFLSEMKRGFGLSLLNKILKPWISSLNMPEKAEKTDWVSGASMMIRWDVITQIGLLDEAYFMYFEEADYCLQAARAGWECWYVPESRVVHYVGQSSGITNIQSMKKQMPQYWFDSRRRYFLKNHNALHVVLADLFWLVGFSIRRIRYFIQRKPSSFPNHLLCDSFKNSVFMRGFSITPTKNS